jgi:hypothetical protein
MNSQRVSRSRGHFQFSQKLASSLVLGLLSLGVAACERADTDEDVLDDSAAAASAPLIRAGAAGGELEKVELVFESRVQETDDKEIVSSEVAGDLSVEQRARVARPYRYVDEGTIYSEEAWSRGGKDGVTERGYRVWKQRNRTPLDIHARTSAPPKVNANVVKFVANAVPEETLELDLKLRNFPEWNVPLAPAGMDMSAADIKAHEERRAGAIREREALFERLAMDVVKQVEALGGRVQVRYGQAGWLGVTVPALGFEALARNTALDRIDGPYGKTGGVDWHLGDGRKAEYLDADRFHVAGFTGDEPNPTRHAYGDIVVGMNETGGYESGACAFKDGVGCTGPSRIAATYRCDDSNDNDGDLCEPGTVETNFCDTDKCTDAHGTATTSVAIGDYRDGQANGKALGDGNFGSSTCSSSAQCNGNPCENGLCAHSTAWETAHTGMAPEAKAVLFGLVKSGATSASLTDMFADSVALNVDISSNSWGWGDTNCDMQADTAMKQQIEIAYDDGILPVFSAGNANGDDATTCQVRDPADLPKVLTINAYDAGTADCTNNPSTRCLLDKVNCPDSDGNPRGCSARGGANVEVAGRGLRTDAVSIVDLVAPNHIGSVTWPSSGTGSDGNPNGGFNGTSAAAPHVAGLAALVKSWYLHQGQTWVNLPGRLQTIMLAMGDRHFSSDPSSATTWTTQLAATPNKWYGLGRARMRLLESSGGLGNWANHFATFTFTSQGTSTYYPFGKGPLPSGIELVKCVAMQTEGMTNKSNISETKLSVRVLPNATGSSCTGTSTATRISDNFDTKKVAALQDVTFTNNCVEVQLEAENVTSQGVTVHAMCYYAGINDDESL